MIELEVNGETIPSEIFARELEQLRSLNVGNPEPMSDESMIMTIKDDIIARTIIRQEALKKDYQIPASELQEAYIKLLDEHGGQNEFFEKFQLGPEDETLLKEDLENNLKVDRFLNDMTSEVKEPTETTVQKYYDDHSGEFIKPGEVHAAHILKSAQGNEEAVYGEMLEIREQLLDGADFSNTADTHSSCNDNGGDLGFFQPGRMVEEFDTIVFSMREGEISPVFSTQFGYHIAKVYEKKPASKMNFSECKDEIKERLHYDLKNDFIGEWVDRQVEQATVSERIVEPENVEAPLASED